MPLRLTEIVKTCTALLLMICTSTAWAANQSRFSVQEVHEDSNGVTLTTIAGLMRIEACGDRVIHVVVSSTAELPNPTVPVVTKPCRGESLKVVVGKKEVVLRTPAVTVHVNRTTGALTFLTKDGESVLAEPKGGGKAFDIPSLFETKTWQVQQTFSSPSEKRCMVSASIRKAFSMSAGFQFACTRPTPIFPFRSCCPAKDTAFSGITHP